VLIALGGCYAVTIALINVPLTRGWLGFAPLSWQTQLIIEAYALAYLFIANAVKRAYHQQVAPVPHGAQPRP
jgi:hypothetical protein